MALSCHSQVPRRIAAIAAALAVLALLAWSVCTTLASGDYSAAQAVGGDNAGPGLWCLAHLRLAAYVSHQPIIGLTSMLVRLPAVLLGELAGSSPLDIYRLGAMACLLPLALGTGWLVAVPGLTREQRLIRLGAGICVAAGPTLRSELWAGHPEGTLTALLATAAVLAAERGRARWSGLLLGAAAGSKEWGIIALAPVLLALPARRQEVLRVAAASFLLLAATVWLADPPAALRALHGEAQTDLVNPLSPLWLAGRALAPIGGQRPMVHLLPLGMHRSSASAVMLGAAAVGTWAWCRGRARAGLACRPLALLALLGLIRCVCDSTHLEYYLIAALVPLAALEASRNRLPILSLLLSFGAHELFAAAGRVSSGALYLLAIAGEAGLIVAVARQAMPALPRSAQASLGGQLLQSPGRRPLQQPAPAARPQHSPLLL